MSHDTRIHNLPSKATPVAADKVRIADSAAGNAEKSATLGSLLAADLARGFMITDVDDSSNTDHWALGLFEPVLAGVTVDGTPTSQTHTVPGGAHVAVNITTLTASGTLRLTGNSVDEQGNTTVGDTEDISVSATGYYKSSKYWDNGSSVVLSSVSGLKVVLNSYRYEGWHPAGNYKDPVVSVYRKHTASTNTFGFTLYKLDFAARTLTTVMSHSETNAGTGVTHHMKRSPSGSVDYDFDGGDRLLLKITTRRVKRARFEIQMTAS